MIRINLLPTKKRKKSGKVALGGGNSAQLWVVGVLIGWIGVAGLGYWLVTIEQTAEQEIRQKVGKINRQVEQVKTEIDEEGQKQREEQLEQLQRAIAELTKKRKTPVYVMYELAMILTDAKDGGGPDIDLEKHRKMVRADPRNEINKRWDPTGVWLTSIKQSGKGLAIDGAARDAADLSEFMRRLRASARFGNVAHPDYQRVDKNKGDVGSRYLTWHLDVGVRSWR